MKHTKTRLKIQTISCTAGVLLIGMLILGTQSPALAGPFFDNPDFILLFPGASQKISYDLPDEFRVGQRIFHTCYVLALPDDFTEPTPLDLIITTEPTIVSGDAAEAVVGIFNTTPTYKLNYVSGGKFTAKVSSVPYGLGLFFTFATRPYNDPEFPIAVKQTFTFAAPAK
jgi:hypothetical protein